MKDSSQINAKKTSTAEERWRVKHLVGKLFGYYVLL